MATSRTVRLPQVCFSDEGAVRHLHLETEWIQGSVDRRDPTRLVHEYIQRMMAWMLFIDPEDYAQAKAMQLGLGAGSLSKFCALRLAMETTVIELNPQVVVACREWFGLPPDGPKLQVQLADANDAIDDARWWGAIDALQVDLYDREAAAPVLDSLPFYQRCRRLLTPRGCMTVNLFGRASSYARSVEKMVAAFGADAVWAFKPTREGNTVVLAQASPSRPSSDVLQARALAIQARWGLPAPKWVRGLRPLQSRLS